ncbi:MAG: hypothetical protein WB383_08350 [Acidimicrobiales bacterium]
MIVPEKTSLRDNAAMIRQFAELGPEWFSAVEVSWEVAGADREGRRRVRLVIRELARSGTVERIFARHNSEPLELVRFDRDVLLATLAECKQ